MHIAVQYYKKCLASSDVQDEHTAAAGTVGSREAGLKREAAFNLSLIYRGTGADDLARKVLQQYVSV